MFRKLLVIALAVCAGGAFAETRIVGGDIATSGAWPSTMSLIVKELAEGIDRGEYAFTDTGELIPAEQANYWAHSCGGSLVTSTWVLTAAHCVVDGETGSVYSTDEYLVLSGTSDLLGSGTRTSIKRIVVHPDYNPLSDESANDADIAILELTQPISQETIAVFTEHLPAGTPTVVTGWGLTEEDGNRSQHLRQVDLPTISNDQCKQSIREFQSPNNPNSPLVVAYADSTLTDNMFCAGDGKGLRDSCQADSGGPLMVLVEGEYAQLGLVSWGYGCARAGTYGVYTRVSNYFSWMNSVINPDSTPTSNPSDDAGNSSSDDATGDDEPADDDSSSDSGSGSDDGSSSDESSGSGGGGGITSLYLLMILGLAGVLRSRYIGALRR